MTPSKVVRSWHPLELLRPVAFLIHNIMTKLDYIKNTTTTIKIDGDGIMPDMEDQIKSILLNGSRENTCGNKIFYYLEK